MFLIFYAWFLVHFCMFCIAKYELFVEIVLSRIPIQEVRTRKWTPRIPILPVRTPVPLLRTLIFRANFAKILGFFFGAHRGNGLVRGPR